VTVKERTTIEVTVDDSGIESECFIRARTEAFATVPDSSVLEYVDQRYEAGQHIYTWVVTA
jgi:hypothetical protein